MKIGLIGLGRIGMVFADVLQGIDGLEVVAFSPARRRRFQHLLAKDGFQFTTEWSIFLKSVPDGFVIASPSDTHVDYLDKLIPMGRPIFCEKPVDLKPGRIEKVMDLADRHGVSVLVGFNRRFDPQVQSLKASLDAKSLGRLHILRLTSRDPAPPPLKFARSSGGLFLDMVIHDFDMIRHLSDAEPTSIFTRAALRVAPRFSEIGDVDTAVSVVGMSDGSIATVDNSRKAVYGYDQRIEAFGDRGMLQMENQRHDETVYYGSKGRIEQPLKDFFMDRYLVSYQNEMRHFVQVVQENAVPLVGLEDALIATRMAVAAGKSWRNRREIKL